jgi:capsular polysaccharide transport system permease protein
MQEDNDSPLFLNNIPLRKRIGIQIRVISALMIRNIVSRYGRGNMGFLWMIIEPMFLVTGVIVMWSVLHADGTHGVPIVTFVLTGYMPLTLWRHTSNYARVMSGNYGLLYHRQISVLDVVIARTLTELVSVTAASVIVYFMLLSAGYITWIAHPSMVLLGWFLMAWFGFANGCLTAGLSEKTEVIENLIQPIQYLILPVSGCFYMVSWLPESVRHLALLVPLPNIYEIFRYGFIGDQMKAYYSIPYVIAWCVVFTFLGVWSMVSARKNLSFR